MCGFAGFIDLKRASSRDDLNRIGSAMADAIRHRGPDSAGIWCEPEAGIALAFRRLAVIDLSPTGEQPMISASGRSVIVFNGEIYNACAIAKELEACEVLLRGRSDTEVLLEAIELWGLDQTLGRVVGMFAFAFYDRASRRILLVRDRLGKKPLYIGTCGNTLFFGSQPKAFAPHPDWRPQLDQHAVALFMRFGYVPSPHSIFQGMTSVGPGECVEVQDGAITGRRRYWDVRDIARDRLSAPSAISDAEAKTQLASLLERAVADRLAADVPMGAFLSGGIDSSLVCAVMQRITGTKIKTFAIGFEEEDYDESGHAEAVARHLGTAHETLMLRPAEALASIPTLSETYDEPFADPSQIPTQILCALTRKHVTVAISGDGGDELFAGYDRYRLADAWVTKRNDVPPLARDLLAAAIRSTPNSVWRWLEPLVPKRFGRSPLSLRANKLADLLTNDTDEHFYADLVGQWTGVEFPVSGVTPRVAPLWNGALKAMAPELVRRFQLIDMLTYLPDDILVKVDRASMAFGLEVRSPLLDHRLLEFSWRLPTRMLHREGASKWLLRQVLYDHVPRALVDRPKKGFGVPIDTWLRGQLRDWAEDLLDERRMTTEGILDTKIVRNAWTQHLSGRTSLHNRLWCVLMFQAWRRRWMPC